MMIRVSDTMYQMIRIVILEYITAELDVKRFFSHCLMVAYYSFVKFVGFYHVALNLLVSRKGSKTF